VPGFVPSKRASAGALAREKQLEAQLARCAGLAAGAASSGAGSGPPEQSSPQFRHPGALLGVGVSSSVSFTSSVATGEAELKLLRSTRMRACLTAYLNALLRGESFGGATVQKVSIQQGTPPAPGTSGGFGWRVTALFTLHGLRVPFYLDTLGFIYKRAQVTLQSSSAALPFPASAEEHLYNLLLERAKAQPL
jgi:hypothetical protein